MSKRKQRRISRRKARRSSKNSKSEIMTNTQEKPWYGSKTIITLLVALMIQIANIFFGAGLDEALGEEIAGLNWDKPVTALLLFAGIIFRIIAKEKIGGIFKKKDK